MKQTNKKTKVLVCMSGGVDSSVAAALLVRAGYDVTGAFMKQFSNTDELTGVCPWKKDRRDALRVAARLGIPLITLDFEKEYKKQVMDYMFREYKAGRTPNPDVLCNTFIKFGVWLDKARALGFEYLATGHYAKIQEIRNKKLEIRKTNSQFLVSNFQFQLLQAKDKNKDQTYFLHQLNQEQLSHVMFPIGEYTKPEVRKLAKKFDLPTAEREESMGICFVGEVPIKEFLQQRIKPKKGKIIFSDGTVIGEHDGLAFYTIGQRHFGSRNQELRIKNQERGALYVVGKNIKKNELIVGFEDDPLLLKKEIEVGEVCWVIGRTPEFPLQCEVRLRHRQKLQKAVVGQWTVDNRQSKQSIVHSPLTIVQFKKSQRAVTPGQFAVFYSKGECLGGGVIL